MVRAVCAAALALAAWAAPAAAENVAFEGTALSGAPLALGGLMTRPPGKGPSPAVVMLHGCSGLRPYHARWAERLAGWGYVALRVDSLGPRAMSSTCARPLELHPRARARDAHAARAYLARQPFVEAARIAVMGWSHGGWSVLYAVTNPGAKRRRPFRAAVALYPWCLASLMFLDAPLLVLIGGADDWTPARRCRRMSPAGETAHRFTLKVYPGAHHGFDAEGADLVYRGHTIRHHPAASADAIERVRAYLAARLRSGRR